MRTAIDKLYKKLLINHIGESKDWKEGYSEGILDAIKIIQDGIDNLLMVGNNYFVIMYQNGDKHFPYIEEMRLYKISIKSRKTYCFSRNLYATQFNTFTPDLVLSNKKSIRKRVFFNKEQAEKTIGI